VKSLYTFAVKGDHGFHLYSSFTGAFLQFEPESISLIESLLEQEYSSLYADENRELIEKLYQHGFLTHSHESEIEKINKRRHDGYVGNEIKSRSFVVALSLDCNFRCSYCYQEISRSRDRSRVSAQTCKRLIEYIGNDFNHGIVKHHITWFGGEPLLETKLITEITREIASIIGLENFSAGMITNGYLLTERAIQNLKASKCDEMQITIDGNRERHNSLRHTVANEGTFDIIMQNIANAVKNGVNVNIRINIDKDDMFAFKDVLNACDEMGLANKLIVGIAATRYYETSKIFDSREFSKIYAEFYRELSKRGYWKSLTLPAVHSASCYMFSKNSINISPDGDFVPCIEEIGDHSTTAPSLGNINDTFNPEIKRFHNETSWVKDIPTKCLDCRILPLCFGGCPREKIGRTSFHMIPGCSMYKYCIEDIIKIIGDNGTGISSSKLS
jgi:uncharacterized protein